MAVRTLDPITTEIIRSAFSAAADEMNATLIRSAYTPIIYEMKDCSVALLDAEHRVLGQSAGLPIFLGNLEICTRLTDEMYGTDAWRPGDVWIMNDSYLTGTHLNDMTVFGPIFVEDELMGFSACRAHWLDVGAKDPGGPMDSTEIYQEGLRLGPTRVVDAGMQRPDVTDLLGRNSRFAYPAVGDLGAQIACVRTGQRRLEAIVDKYGAHTILAARDEIFAQTERFERAAVEAIADGVYRAEGCLDNDGVCGEPCWVRLMVEVYGDAMVIGIAGVDDRTQRPFFDLEPTVGGWGAWQGCDGEDGLINNVNGSLKDLPIEVIETKFPIRMTQYGFRPDSGGPGRWRGGNGVVREYTLDCDSAELFLWFERSVTPAWGLFGGRTATPPVVILNPGREGERRMLKASRVPLKRGDVVRTMTGGGGGFGAVDGR